MNEYGHLLRVREEQVDGEGPWIWVAQDRGAWDGPKHDWETSHKQGILDLVTDWTNCIQAGGNQGMYPRLMSKMFQHVYTFEPDPLNFYCLVVNCCVENIYPINAALGDESGLVKVNRGSLTNTGEHKVTTNGDCHVPMFTIDSLKLPTCGLIQLDLEEYELNALKGAMETIVRCKPVIQCECGNDDILNLLRPFGYEAVATSKADTFYKVV